MRTIQLWPQWQLSSCDLSDSYPVENSVRTIQLWPQWQLSSCDLSDSYPVENSVRTIQLWPQWQLSSWELSENYPAVTSVTAIQLWPQWELRSCDPSKSFTKSNQYLFRNGWFFFFFFSFFPCCLLTELYFRLTRWLQSIQLGPTTSTAPTMAWSVFRFLAYFHTLCLNSKIQDIFGMFWCTV